MKKSAIGRGYRRGRTGATRVYVAYSVVGGCGIDRLSTREDGINVVPSHQGSEAVRIASCGEDSSGWGVCSGGIGGAVYEDEYVARLSMGVQVGLQPD